MFDLKDLEMAGATFALLVALTPAAGAQSQVEKSLSRTDPVAIYQEAGADLEQQDKIRELARNFEKTARVKTERLKNLSQRMRAMSLEAEPDEQVVLALQDEINSLQAEIATSRIKLMLGIRGILTSEQKTKLVQLMKEKNANYQSGLTAH